MIFGDNMMQQNTYENITQIGIVLYNLSMQALVDLREFDKNDVQQQLMKAATGACLCTLLTT